MPKPETGRFGAVISRCFTSKVMTFMSDGVKATSFDKSTVASKISHFSLVKAVNLFSFQLLTEELLYNRQETTGGHGAAKTQFALPELILARQSIIMSLSAQGGFAV